MGNIKATGKLMDMHKPNKNLRYFSPNGIKEHNMITKPVIASNITGDISLNPILNKVFIKDNDC